MIKLIFKFVKKIIVAICLLYTLNLLISSINIVIPINYLTVFLVSFLGIPGLCMIIGLFFLV